jgi:hypothetical protein
MTWLGHKRMDETLRYVHVAEGHRRELPPELRRGHALSRMSELTPARWAANQEDLVGDVIDGKMPEPQSQAGKRYSGKFVVRIPPAVHKKLALKAMARGESLNQFVAEALAHA